jgi:hypothetical protein
MAIISIPSSIGGVSIPGLSTNGPLGLLYGNGYTGANYQYPRDLGSITKGHIIKFRANEIKPIDYQENSSIKIDKDLLTISGVKSAVTELTSATVSAISSINLSLTKREKIPKETISLYIPDTVNFTTSAKYGDLSTRNTLIKAVGLVPIIGSPFAKSLNSIVQSDITKLALSTQGLALNPQNQFLFDGIDFRSYQMAFTFTPYSREEAQMVRDIIKVFRMYALPRITNGGAGMFFVPPGTFDVQFLYNGKENKNINKVAESVIETIDVNYAPNGWSTHEDGAPVQTTVTISFKEIELIDRAKVKEGY